MKRAFTCKVCGKPGEVWFESTGNPEVDEFIGRLATRMAVHNYCAPFRDKEPEPEQAPLPYKDE